MPIEVVCEWCEGTFTVPPYREDSAKYCSQDCFGEAKTEKNTVIKTCEHCGEEFESLEYKNQVYCSNGCNTASQRKRTTLECPICDSEFEVIEAQEERRRCCSMECMGEWISQTQTGENHHNYVESVDVECWTCGKPLERTPGRVARYENHFCNTSCYSEFVSERKSGENHYKWKPDELTQYGKGWNEEKREKVRERDNRKCQDCGEPARGYFSKLDVHHIQPADTFDDPEKRNAMDNLISLCRECHPKWEKFAPLRPQ